jgi:hypothetical protein
MQGFSGKANTGQGRGSVVQYLPGMFQALDSIPSAAKTKEWQLVGTGLLCWSQTFTGTAIRREWQVSPEGLV